MSHGKAGLADRCTKLSEGAPETAGECFVKGLRPYMRREQPKWERAMVRLARGQSPSCRKALRAYLLASRKSQHANLAYYDAHAHLDFSRLDSFLYEKPYAGLAAATQHARKEPVASRLARCPRRPLQPQASQRSGEDPPIPAGMSSRARWPPGGRRRSSRRDRPYSRTHPARAATAPRRTRSGVPPGMRAVDSVAGRP